MKRFDAICGGVLLLLIVATAALGDAKGGPASTLLAVGFVGVIAAWLLVRVMLICFHLGRCVTRDVVHLATGGSVRTLPQHGIVRPHRERSSQGMGFIERLCYESGWLLVSQENDVCVVRSGDHTSQVRVQVRWSPRFLNVVFWARFPVRFSLEREAPGLNARLLMRNRDLHWSSWTMELGESCEACPYVTASVPPEGLSAELFGHVCQEIVGEINAFHAELHSKFAYGLGQATMDTSYRVQVQQDVRGGLPMRQGNNLPVRRQGENLPGVWYQN